jgi:hypothetical protein
VRILFLVHNLGRTRHFESVIQGLARRRHTVVLAAARKRKPLKPTKALHGEERVEVTACPVRRIDRWERHAEPLRRIGDHLRFFDPRCAHMGKIAARAATYTPPEWRATLQRRPWIRARWSTLARAVAAADRLIPPDPYFEMYLKAERADLLLVTPLVDFSSYQADYLRAAHRLGIPAAFLPFSWDNLTNRGLIRGMPDRVFVWNEHQRREAIDLHDVPAERVVVTGAPRFDAFIALRPATTRRQFCDMLGLDADRPLLLYVCSSGFVAPREVEFVRRWVEELRRSADPELRKSGVVVRPHPANQEQWTDDALADLPGVALWREKSEMNADQGLYDSLYHAIAVAGLNTSAMIEAAIVERPVYSVSPPEFAGGQGETMHFSYLLAENGGPVRTGATLAEHFSQMAADRADRDGIRERSRAFVASFVRPRGLERPATEVMIEELERLGVTPKKRERTALGHSLARKALLTLLDARR